MPLISPLMPVPAIITIYTSNINKVIICLNCIKKQLARYRA